jgi:hypothetical protein
LVYGRTRPKTKESNVSFHAAAGEKTPDAASIQRRLRKSRQ